MAAIQATASGTATRFGRRWADFSRLDRREHEGARPEGLNLPAIVGPAAFVERRRRERPKPAAPFVTQLIACANREPRTGGVAAYDAPKGFPAGSIVTREF